MVKHILCKSVVIIHVSRNCVKVFNCMTYVSIECDGDWMLYNGHCYLLNRTKLSWPDAKVCHFYVAKKSKQNQDFTAIWTDQHFVLLQSECTRCGAYLVEIKNEDENKWIEEYLLQDVCKHKFITFFNGKLAVENNVL